MVDLDAEGYVKSVTLIDFGIAVQTPSPSEPARRTGFTCALHWAPFTAFMAYHQRYLQSVLVGANRLLAQLHAAQAAGAHAANHRLQARGSSERFCTILLPCHMHLLVFTSSNIFQ